MIPSTNLNNIVDKKLELGHPSLQRAQRWIADANQNVYESWYPTKTTRISISSLNSNKESSVLETTLFPVQNSFLARLSNLLNPHRKPVHSEG